MTFRLGARGAMPGTRCHSVTTRSRTDDCRSDGSYVVLSTMSSPHARPRLVNGFVPAGIRTGPDPRFVASDTQACPRYEPMSTSES
jgi:hypothetical protein